MTKPLAAWCALLLAVAAAGLACAPSPSGADPADLHQALTPWRGFADTVLLYPRSVLPDLARAFNDQPRPMMEREGFVNGDTHVAEDSFAGFRFCTVAADDPGDWEACVARSANHRVVAWFGRDDDTARRLRAVLADRYVQIARGDDDRTQVYFLGDRAAFAPLLDSTESRALAALPPRVAADLDPAGDILLERIALARRYMAANLDTARGGIPWFHHALAPTPGRRHAGWDWCDIASRYAAAFWHSADLFGSPQNIDYFKMQQELILGSVTRDGLAYRKMDVFSDIEADIFDQGSVMLYLIAAWRATGDERFATAIDATIAGLRKVAVATPHGVKFAHPTLLPDGGRGPGRDNWGEADPCHHGGRLLYPLSLYLQYVPNNKGAAELFADLAGFILEDSGVYAADGSFAGHTHSRTNTLLGLLLRARQTGDGALAARVKRSVDWLVATTPAWGWISEFMPNRGEKRPENERAETDALVDVLEIIFQLTPDNPMLWDTADRYIRNGLLRAQFTAAWPGPDDPRGTFCGFCEPNGFGDRTMNCCTPAGAEGLIAARRRAVERVGGTTWVNLSFDRTGAPATVKTETTDEAFRVSVTPTESGEVAVRVPAYAAANRATVRLGGGEARWVDGVPVFRDVAAGASVWVEMPRPAREERFTVGGRTYTYHWRGNQVVGVEPAAPRFGLFP